MANSKIIIFEGAQGAGKTSATDFVRSYLPYTNLYRLAGTADKTVAGLEKARKMYNILLDYVENMENLSINLLFDRTFFTEEIYCRLGFKEYVFDQVYNSLVERLSGMDFDIYYITLYLEDESLFEDRLKREGKGVTDYAKYAAESSIKQQNAYLQIAAEIEQSFPNIKVRRISNDGSRAEFESKIKEALEI